MENNATALQASEMCHIGPLKHRHSHSLVTIRAHSGICMFHNVIMLAAERNVKGILSDGDVPSSARNRHGFAPWRVYHCYLHRLFLLFD